MFCSEPSTGGMEYKLHLEDFTQLKYERYSTQLKYRILEGEGEAVYLIGVSDKGNITGIPISRLNQTIDKLNYICNNVSCKISFVMRCSYDNIFFLIIKVIACFDMNKLKYLI